MSGEFVLLVKLSSHGSIEENAMRNEELSIQFHYFSARFKFHVMCGRPISVVQILPLLAQ